MLLILILVGLFIYVGLFFGFSAFTTSDSAHSGTAITVYEKLQNVVFKMPASLPMAIFKVMLGIFIVYGIYDFTTTTVRRTRLRRDQAQRKADLHRTLHGDG